MELPNLGRHCQLKNCELLDFLPYICDLCGDTFCHDHHKYDSHDCPKKDQQELKAPICPICEKPVVVLPNEDINVKISNHIENGCVDIELKQKK